jgi:hypothetical protein
MEPEFKNKTTGELVSVVIFEFHNWPSLWLTKEQYHSEGGYRGWIKSQCIPVGELKKLHKININPHDFPTEEWCP